jgi:hypothetical protein
MLGVTGIQEDLGALISTSCRIRRSLRMSAVGALPPPAARLKPSWRAAPVFGVERPLSNARRIRGSRGRDVPRRRCGGVFAADGGGRGRPIVAGYSRLLGADKEGTIPAFRAAPPVKLIEGQLCGGEAATATRSGTAAHHPQQTLNRARRAQRNSPPPFEVKS